MEAEIPSEARESPSPDTDQLAISKLFAICSENTSNQKDELEILGIGQLNLDNVTNSSGETPIHVATKSGKLEVVKALVEKGASVNTTNQNGDTPLVIAIKSNKDDITNYFIEQKADLNIKNKLSNETALHTGVRSSNGKVVESMILTGADINAQDSKGCTSLHLACKNENIPIACMLIYLGAKTGLMNFQQETPLHEACRRELFPVVQLMCSKECPVNVTNKLGLTPLHLASKAGNIDIVRQLLLTDADIDAYNKDGLRAEDMALAQGYFEVSGLLSKLSNSIAVDQRNTLVRQLKQESSPIDCIKVKIFGSQGVGKSTLIDSLKCGFFWSFVRKAWGYGSDKKLRALIDPMKSWLKTPHENYTKGIDVHQVSVSGVGNLSIWEFSGFEPYFAYYDYFIGDPSCIHVVTFNLSDAYATYKSQIFFWLNFIRDRIAPAEPIGFGGTHLWSPHVVFVATHASNENCSKDSTGNYVLKEWNELIKEIKDGFQLDLIILPKPHILDAKQANSIGMRDLRNTIWNLKDFLTKYVGSSMGILPLVMEELPLWVQMLKGGCPTVTWSSFIEYIRVKINALLLEGHAKELVNQMQIVGQIIYLMTPHTTQEDLIVLDPKWLTTQILGKVLAYETIQFSPIDGRFSPESLSSFFSDVDLPDLKKMLQSLDLCLESVYPDGQIFYDFPALDFTPHPPDVWIDWPPKSDGDKTKDSSEQQAKDEIWHGIQIGTMYQDDNYGNQINVIYPRIAIELRRALINEKACPAVIRELRQWGTGMRVDSDNFSATVTLSITQQHIDIITRGFKGNEKLMFALSEYFCEVVLNKIQHICPGLCLQRFGMSPSDLSKTPTVDQIENEEPYYVRVYDSKEILESQLQFDSETTSCHDYVVAKNFDKKETDESSEDMPVEKLIDLLAFGSEEVYSSFILGKDVHISQLPVHARYALAQLLDDVPPISTSAVVRNDNNETGQEETKSNSDDRKGWRDLAKLLQVSDSVLTEKEQAAEKEGKVTVVPVSKTDAVLALWSYKITSTIGALTKVLEELQRFDARDIILRFSPMFFCQQTSESDKK